MNLVSTRYAFASAYLKGEEARTVMFDHLNGVVQKSKDVQDVLDVIKDTDVGEYLTDVAMGVTLNFKDMDDHLWRYLDTCIDRFRRFKIPHDMITLLDAYMKKYDIMNVKATVRCILTGEASSMVPLGEIVRQGHGEEFSQAKSIEEVADILVAANLSDYASVVKESIKEKDPKSTFEGEFKLESLYYEHLMQVLKASSDGSTLVRAWGVIIDLSNVHIVFRSALGGKRAVPGEYMVGNGHMLSDDMLRELCSLKMNEIAARLEYTEYSLMAQDAVKNYEKEKTITVVDKTIEKHRVRLLSELLSPRALSPCNLLWYLILKELEIRNLRMVFKAIMDGIPLAEIKDYLVYAS